MPGVFEPGTGSANGSFIHEDERHTLVKQGATFPINKVIKSPSQYGMQFLCEVELDGEDRILAFSATTVPNRIAGFERIIEMQEAGEYKPITVRLVKDGKAT